MDSIKSKRKVRAPRDVITIVVFANECEQNSDYASAESAWRQALALYALDRRLNEHEIVNVLRKISDVCCAQGKYEEATLIFCLYKKSLQKLQMQSTSTRIKFQNH